MPPEISDDIVRELQHAIRTTAAPPARLEPIEPLALMAHRRQPDPFPPRRRTRWDVRGMLSLIPWFLGAGIVVMGLLYITQYGLSIKGRVVRQGMMAMNYLVTAQDDLKQLNIEQAKKNLEQARLSFNDASRELDILGPSLITLISHVPGLSSLRIGKDLLDAGRLLSEAGATLGSALTAMGGTGNALEAAAPLKEAFTVAHERVVSAEQLIALIDPDQLPEQYREQFDALRERLPVVHALADRAIATGEFLSQLTGVDQPKRYLVLFSNSSELRPTGGFPGSYGLLTFEGGRVKDFHADDIYNPDGQIKELVVPPIQLQHITPGWGMRDAAWWADFPTSAKKVMQYWQKGGGAAVDGVMSIKPDILAGILKITGPISMPSYDLVFTSENVVAALQSEVEDNKNEAQPKQIIVDLAPLILKRLSAASASQMAQLAVLLKDGLDSRDVLMYFTDADIETFAAAQGWDGAIKHTDGDYLMVNVSNIKGAKADAVTDTSVTLESWTESGAMVHRLTLTRRHNGGSSAYGFYNKPNYSWVRVLVPEGSVLRGISGNDTAAHYALMQYTGSTSTRDGDLDALEATYQNGINRTITYSESGKTGFGFWMTVKPGETQTVQLEYAVPAKYSANDYTLYVQRQPGLSIRNFEFSLQKPSSLFVVSSQPTLKEWPDSWRLNDPLSRDLNLAIQLQ